jgi:hypothetical protein
VRYLWFCIELEPYDCTKCDSRAASSGETSFADNELILEAFRSLFLALSKWEPKGSLTLDISLYSNSDKEHAFKYLTFLPDAQGHGVEQKLVAGNEENNKHRWEASESGPLVPPENRLERLFAQVWLPWDEEAECWQQAPKVPAVTRLVMRLQTQRRWLPQTVTHILSHLPSLREFHYEPWRHWFTEMQEILDECEQSQHCMGRLPAKFNKLTSGGSPPFFSQFSFLFYLL